MQHTNKPNYDQPSYEGLYFYAENHKGELTYKGYVERLLPNGKYVIYREYLSTYEWEEANVSEEALDQHKFFVSESIRDRAVEAHWHYPQTSQNFVKHYDELCKEHFADEIAEYEKASNSVEKFFNNLKTKQERTAIDTVTNGNKRLVKVTDNFPKGAKK